MSLANWQKIKEIFLEAIELAPAQRARLIEEKCGADDELRAEIEKLLLQDEEAGGLISRPAIEKTAAHFFAEKLETADPLIGQTVGAYHLIEEIGRGGMGAVYLAERADGSFRRLVAVKLIKRGMETEFILRRFRNERQVLATLSHPFIAQLYDGGTTPNGLPYFVMEYVDGEPLYKFCDHRKLNVKERLEIFLRVCEAVHAAHRLKIVHRDLKPSNVLVKSNGMPKLLDFGIAKLLDTELADTLLDPTATAMRMMTPEYASPEQVSGGEITPASDIYSLGVMLYELLSGHRPYRLKNRSPLEIARVVCEQPPESLSRSLESGETFLEKGEAATLEKVLESRGSNLAQLRRELSGELEQIVMQALSKKPDERYPDALELAEDIGLYRANKPLKIRLQTAAKPASSAKDDEPSLAVLPLQFFGTRASEDAGDNYLSLGLADAMISKLSNVRRLVVRPTSSILRFGDAPDAFAAGRELNVDFVLSGTIRRAGERIRVSAQLLDIKTGATVWADKFDENFTDVLELEDTVAERVAKLLVPRLTGEEQKKLARRVTDSPAAFEAYLRGRYHLFQMVPAEFTKAKNFFEAAVRLDPHYALAYVGLAEYYFVLGAFAPVPPLETYQNMREMTERALAIDDSLGEAYAILGYAYFANFDFEKVEKMLRHSIELNPHHTLSRMWLSIVLAYFGRFDEAVAESYRAVELNPLGAFEQIHLAWVLYQTRRFDEAVAVGRKAVASDPHYSYGRAVFSWILRYLGQTDEALEHAARAVELSGGNPWMGCNLAACCGKAGEMEKARGILREIENATAGNYVLPSRLVVTYLNLGDRERALSELEKGLAVRDPMLVWIRTDPECDVLRGDARFIELQRRIENFAE
jgi:eukaryotic-like serine/threonine-protein kinase